MSIDEKAEKILEILAQQGFNHLPDLFDDKIGDYSKEHQDYVVVVDALESQGLITETTQKHTYKITAKGRRVVDSGGYIKYLRQQEAAEEFDKTTKALTQISLESQIKTNKRNLIVAWIGIGISFLTALASLYVSIYVD